MSVALARPLLRKSGTFKLFRKKKTNMKKKKKKTVLQEILPWENHGGKNGAGYFDPGSNREGKMISNMTDVSVEQERVVYP